MEGGRGGKKRGAEGETEEEGGRRKKREEEGKTEEEGGRRKKKGRRRKVVGGEKLKLMEEKIRKLINRY